MKRKLIGLLFACSLVCASAVRAEVTKAEVVSVIDALLDEDDVRGASSPFNQVIKIKIDNEVMPKLCNLDAMTTTTIIPKLCDINDTVTTINENVNLLSMGMTVTSLADLLLTATVIPKLCDIQDTVTAIENTIDTSLLPKVCTMLMSVTNIELLTTTTVVPKLCNLDAMTTTTIIPKLCDILDTVTTSCPRIPITAPQTISAPGSYCLANDIGGQIIIASSNVTLDLNGYAISVGAINGIQISDAAAYNNIVIKNGTIESSASLATGGAIARPGNTFASTNIVLQDLIISGATSGVRIDNSFDIKIKCCVITGELSFLTVNKFLIDQCVIMRDDATGDVLLLDASSSGIVRNCDIANSGGGTGLRLTSGTSKIEFLNCVIEHCSNGVFSAGTIENIVFDHCVTYSMTSGGFRFTNARNIEFYQCAAHDNAQAGFEIGADCSNVTFDKCHAYGNRGASFANGFSIGSRVTDISLRECVAYNNADNGFIVNGTTSGNASSRILFDACVATFNDQNGFEADDTFVTNVTFHECEAQGNLNHGFELSGSGAGRHVQECRALNNSSTGFNGSTPTYVANFATGNGTNYSGGINDVAVSIAAASSRWENVEI